MPEQRDCRFMINLEPTFKLLLDQAANADGVSASVLMRKLLLRELDVRGLLTREVLLRVATTDGITDLEHMLEERERARA